VLSLVVGRTSFCCLFSIPLGLCRIAIGRTGTSSEHVDQHIMVLPSTEAKRQWLIEMLPVLAPLGRCIVFVATRDGCDELSKAMQISPIFANGESVIVSIHGDKDQSDRNAAISRFKKKPRAVIIATDVVSMKRCVFFANQCWQVLIFAIAFYNDVSSL
jgi:superfamily II DNA/RNA helicase